MSSSVDIGFCLISLSPSLRNGSSLVFPFYTFSISRIVVAILLVDAMLFISLIGLESVTSKPMVLYPSF